MTQWILFPVTLKEMSALTLRKKSLKGSDFHTVPQQGKKNCRIPACGKKNSSRCPREKTPCQKQICADSECVTEEKDAGRRHEKCSGSRIQNADQPWVASKAERLSLFFFHFFFQTDSSRRNSDEATASWASSRMMKLKYRSLSRVSNWQVLSTRLVSIKSSFRVNENITLTLSEPSWAKEWMDGRKAGWVTDGSVLTLFRLLCLKLQECWYRENIVFVCHHNFFFFLLPRSRQCATAHKLSCFHTISSMKPTSWGVNGPPVSLAQLRGRFSCANISGH